MLEMVAAADEALESVVTAPAGIRGAGTFAFALGARRIGAKAKLADHPGNAQGAVVEGDEEHGRRSRE